jgi:hypothetical protein
MAVICDDVPTLHSYSEVGRPVIYAESYQQRLERLLEYKDKNHKVANVIAVRERPEGNYAVKEQFTGNNVVTDAGEIAYAQKAAAEAPTNDFWAATGRFTVRDNATPLTPGEGDTYTAFSNPVTGSTTNGARTAGYPKTNDTLDTDNTGDSAQAISWAKLWATTDFTATNVSGLVYTAISSPTTGTPLLFHSVFSPVFGKAATDTLKVFVNHTFEAV